jgi:hypothetical protein
MCATSRRFFGPFSGISLRIRGHSGAIDATSRKGVGPGLWGVRKLRKQVFDPPSGALCLTLEIHLNEKDSHCIRSTQRYRWRR